MRTLSSILATAVSPLRDGSLDAAARDGSCGAVGLGCVPTDRAHPPFVVLDRADVEIVAVIEYVAELALSGSSPTHPTPDRGNCGGRGDMAAEASVAQRNLLFTVPYELLGSATALRMSCGRPCCDGPTSTSTPSGTSAHI